ncbi:hypothetical protein HGRIS_005844 [Hohenbuehelia grisea]|uniref:SET domain-containing protein n=1 Tax=Hohenbuehelia grisea TaxID=104357 RepID=A0ABR3JZI0_9AGAR
MAPTSQSTSSKARASASRKQSKKVSTKLESSKPNGVQLSLFSLLIASLGIAIFYFVPRSHAPVQSAENGSATAFKEVSLDGRGIGLVATRDIEPGELLIRERPLFVVPPEVSSPLVLISNILMRMQPHEREAFMNLSYVDVNFPAHLTDRTGKPEDHPLALALAIFQTNAVSAGSHVGLFPRMARLNHGCAGSFNSVYSWREDEGELVVHAIKRIAKDQELLTTYTDTKKTRSQRRCVRLLRVWGISPWASVPENSAPIVHLYVRREYLAQTYGFHCSCACCSLPADQSRNSDIRLSAMAMLYSRLAEWGDPSKGVSGRQAIEFAREIITLGDEEGYVSERGRLAADAAWVAAAHSDADAFREWALLAHQWYSIELGRDSKDAQEMERLAENPESHSAWGTRGKGL